MRYPNFHGLMRSDMDQYYTPHSNANSRSPSIGQSYGNQNGGMPHGSMLGSHGSGNFSQVNGNNMMNNGSIVPKVLRQS